VVYSPSAKFDIKVFDVEIPRAGSSPMLARVYQPQGSGPFPMLLDQHGGAWSAGDRFNDEWIDTPLAESGILVLSPEFRIGPDPYPHQMQDIDLAARWFKANASKLNGDVNTLGCVGFSSGGHTVVLCAMRAKHPLHSAIPLPGAEAFDSSMKYVISQWPVIDPLARYERAKEKGNTELVERHDRFFLTIENQIDANPVRILERRERVELPPTLVLHGTADDSVPFEWVEKFAELYRKAGGECHIEAFQDAPHGFGRQPQHKERTIAVTKAFIQRCVAAVPV